MESLFASRLFSAQKSFIREILKVTERDDVISFAGGLPDPGLFPVTQIAEAAQIVLSRQGAEALQYSTTEGFPPLVERICQHYGDSPPTLPENILITSGSQQGLDLVGRLFLDTGDRVALESPSYLGAIQAFGLYEPEWRTLPIEKDGLDTTALDALTAERSIKLLYSVPNFQNPSGVTCSETKRREIARLAEERNFVYVEDDPYGALRFHGEPIPLTASFAPERVVTLGSFSKTIAPGFRLGWVRAAAPVIERLVALKQASDLHSNSFCQRIFARYLADNDVAEHIATITKNYGRRCDHMYEIVKEKFPDDVCCQRPDGGMFLWVTLPERISAMTLFEKGVEQKVVVVPGAPFYVDGGGERTVRLNFSNATIGAIDEGLTRLAKVIDAV